MGSGTDVARVHDHSTAIRVATSFLVRAQCQRIVRRQLSVLMPNDGDQLELRTFAGHRSSSMPKT